MVGRFPEKYGRWMSPAFFFQPLLLLEKSLDPQSSHIVTKNVHLELQALCADVSILIFNMHTGGPRISGFLILKGYHLYTWIFSTLNVGIF